MNSPKLLVSSLILEVPNRRLLDGFELRIDSGESVAITGASGSGKSTLLSAMAGIIRPTAGAICIDGTHISELSARQRASFRLQSIGMVFQSSELMPELNVVSNVALPLQLNSVDRKVAEKKAIEILNRMQLDYLIGRDVEGLSGGESQRIAIARALVGNPSVILADEPTGALDEWNSKLVSDILVEQARSHEVALVTATHDPLVAGAMDRIIDLRRFAPKPDTAERM